MLLNCLSMYKSIQRCYLKWWMAEKMFRVTLMDFFEKKILFKTCNFWRRILGSDMTKVEMRVNMPKKNNIFLKMQKMRWLNYGSMDGYMPTSDICGDSKTLVMWCSNSLLKLYSNRRASSGLRSSKLDVAARSLFKLKLGGTTGL